MRKSRTQPLVTVGITSYHSAATIQRCVDSVVQQSLPADQIEVLLADDGSSDRTRRLAHSAGVDAGWSRFEVLRQRNTGNASTGRNKIISSARGRYVFLMDADDYLGPDALKATTAAAKRHSADVVVGRYIGVDRSAPNVLGAENLPIRHDYHSGWLNTLHIQKLFRTDFLRSLPYQFNPQLNYANDHPYMIQAFIHARRVAFVHDTDCYFLTLGEAAPGGTSHVSRASLSATEQLRFLHDCFGLLALGRGQGGRTAKTAGKMRADYWNRLLKLHLPVLLMRKEHPADAVELAHAAANLADIYGAQTARSRLAPGATRMLEVLGATQPELILETAQTVRAEASTAR